MGSDDGSWWQQYQRNKEHPFTSYLDPGYRPNPKSEEAVAFMREFLIMVGFDGWRGPGHQQSVSLMADGAHIIRTGEKAAID